MRSVDPLPDREKSPALHAGSVGTILTGLLSFMNDSATTTGSINTSKVCKPSIKHYEHCRPGLSPGVTVTAPGCGSGIVLRTN